MTGVQSRLLARLAEIHPLAVALGLSLLIHGSLYGTWQLGKRFGWWNHQANWLAKLSHVTRKRALAAEAARKSQPPQEQPRIIPMSFIEVDPASAALLAPKDAKHYSAFNSKAANDTPLVEAKPKPKVDGEQEKVERLRDQLKPNPVPLQPVPPQETVPAEDTLPKPKGAEKVGDLALAKPNTPKEGIVDTGPGDSLNSPRERPRTLAAARAQKIPSLAGEKMKQDGGVSQRGKVSFDAKATPFGAYDGQFINAVETRWHSLLEATPFAQRSGKVVLDFRLHHDGRISDISVDENQVGDILSLLCQRAILDPSPFPKWPPDMRRMIGASYRDIRFTFYYN